MILHTFIMSPHIYLSLNFVHIYQHKYVCNSMHICLHLYLLLCIPIYYDWKYSCSHKFTWRLALRYCLRKHSDRTHSTSHCRSGLSLGYLWCPHIYLCMYMYVCMNLFSTNIKCTSRVLMQYLHVHIYIYMFV